MKKFIKTNSHGYINVDTIMIIKYTPPEDRIESQKNAPVDVRTINGDWYEISTKDAQELLGLEKS